MNFEKLQGVVQLLRPLNAAIVFLTIIVAAFVVGAQERHLVMVLLGALAGAVIAGGANAINDYFDVEIDKVNRPSRPLPSGILHPTSAWWAWRISSSLGVLLSAYVGPLPFLIAVAWVVMLYWYSKRWKRMVFIGNLTVGVATGLAFIYGGAIVGNLKDAYIPSLFAFLVNLARELVKDAEDVAGDRQGQAMTLAVRHGVPTALGVATVTLAALVLATFVPSYLGIYNSTYLAIVAVVDVLLVLVIVGMWRTPRRSNLARSSLLLKVSMILGLAAIYFGTEKVM
jgi:geranylgeranylglycerol-phosphate geranylgeranyltransferase